MGNKFGVKWSELLIPAAAGAIGSLNPWATRGVGLGLQAYDVMKKHQVTPEQEEAKKKFSEMFGGYAEEERQLAQQARQGRTIEDETAVGKWGLQGSASPSMPKTSFSAQISGFTPSGEQKRGLGLDQRQQQTLIGQEMAGPSGFEGLPLQKATPQGEAEWEAFGEEIHAPDNVAANQHERQARAYETIQALATLKPETAGYMGAQLGYQGVKNADDIATILAQEKAYARNNQDKHNKAVEYHKITHGDEVALAMWKYNNGDHYTLGGNNEEGYVAFDKRKGELISLKSGLDKNPAAAIEKFRNDPEKLMDMYRQFSDLAIDMKYYNATPEVMQQITGLIQNVYGRLAAMGFTEYVDQTVGPPESATSDSEAAFQRILNGLNIVPAS
jgi:hypothetical protein